MERTGWKIVLDTVIILALSFFFLFLFSSYVPFHMDELGHYHALCYSYYPLNKLNIFREFAGIYDLAPFFGCYLPLRSCSYIGSFPCLIYYPLFKLWPSPYSARFLGLMMLALQALLIHKLLKTPPLISFILLVSFMPYAFQHIVDFGTTIFQATSVFLICYLTQKWMYSLRNDIRHAWMYPFFIGVTIFFGIWTKLIFFALIPGILILFFYFIFERKEISTPLLFLKRKKILRHFVILFVSAGVLTFILLNSTDKWHHKYYQLVGYYARHLQPIPKASLVKYLLNPLLSADRIFTIEKYRGIARGFFLIATIASMFLSGIRQLYLKKIKYSYAILNICLFFLTFFLVSLHQKSWGMHHVIVAFPFLILAIFYIYSKLTKSKPLFILLLLFVVVNFSFYYDLSKLHYKEAAHPSLLKINKLLNDSYAGQYVFIVIDWGMYYIKALYGDKNQCVLYIEPLCKEEQIKKIKRILAILNRKALFIGRIDSVSNLSLINQNFSDPIQLQTDFNTGRWRVWYQR